MTVLSSVPPAGVGDTFCHEALLYSGDEGFLAGTLPFIRDAVAAADPMLVVVSRRKIGLLRAALGDEAEAVRFADMDEVGRNPARIIPVWRDFVEAHWPEGRIPRGIGEPVWPGRRAAELAECVRHEALLNVAFAGAPAWWLLCPYDTAALEPAAVAYARATHPVIRRGADRVRSEDYGPDVGAVMASDPLPEPTDPPDEHVFTAGPLDGLRRHVARQAARAGVAPDVASDLVLAVNEVATNSLRHAGGRATLRSWRNPDGFVCEVRDGGYVHRPLTGRERPPVDWVRGRGLWMVNQICDLVQLRSSPEGTVVRLHTWIP